MLQAQGMHDVVGQLGLQQQQDAVLGPVVHFDGRDHVARAAAAANGGGNGKRGHTLGGGGALN